MNQIVLEILNWYVDNSRKLPWRNTIDPYEIWLSEIILQQTQVSQGLNYFEKFIEKYPNVSALAAADEENILKLWQGLGYYSRARNLHKTARIVMEEHHGKFPENYDDLLKLPGIGEYTAAAIASFAFNKKHPVLDGNVYRLISRLFNIHLPIDEHKNRKVFMQILNEMISEHSPRIFNNAIMEMGAIICKPSNPECFQCPVSHYCLALKENTISELPVKHKKLMIKTRYLNFIHLDFQNGFYLEKRTEKDIWHNLYQLPLIETTEASDLESIRKLIAGSHQINGQFEIIHKSNVRHLLTHQILKTDFWYVKLNEKPDFINKNMVYTSIKNYKIYAIPKLIDNYLLLL